MSNIDEIMIEEVIYLREPRPGPKYHRVVYEFGGNVRVYQSECGKGLIKKYINPALYGVTFKDFVSGLQNDPNYLKNLVPDDAFIRTIPIRPKGFCDYFWFGLGFKLEDPDF